MRKGSQNTSTGIHKHFIYSPKHCEPIANPFLNIHHIEPDQKYSLMLVDDNCYCFEEIGGYQILNILSFLKEEHPDDANYYDLIVQTVNTLNDYKNTKDVSLKDDVIILTIALIFLQKNYSEFAEAKSTAFEVHLYGDSQKQLHMEVFGMSNTIGIKRSLKAMQKAERISKQFERDKGAPRPNRFQKTMHQVRQHFSDNAFDNVSRCMNDGAIYVIDDLIAKIANPEHIVSSLGALSDFDKLHLPHPHIWVEQATPLKSQNGFGLEEDVYLSVAAYEKPHGIFFNLFVEFTRGKGLCVHACKVSFHHGEVVLEFEKGKEYIEEPSQPYDFLNAAAGILLNFLFLLNCEQAEIKTISHQKPPKRAANSNRSNKKKRDYTLIRFSRYVSDKPKANSKKEGPHRFIVRCGHIWGKNTREPEQQRWVDATLVRIAANDNDANTVKKPSYRLSRH